MFGALFQAGDEEGGAAGAKRSLTSSKRVMHIQHGMDEPSPGRGPSGFVGLENQGATCYLNSLIQMMYMTPELREGLFQVDPEELGILGLQKEEEEKRAAKKAAAAAAAANNEGGERGSSNSTNSITNNALEAMFHADPRIVKSLMDIGFSKNGSERAAIACQKQGHEACLEWACNHSNDPDFDQPLPLPVHQLPPPPPPPSASSSTSKGRERAGAPTATTGSKPTTPPPPSTASNSNSISATSKKGSKVRPIPFELQRLFAQLQLANQCTLSTDDLTHKGFAWQSLDGTVQHDVHELVRLLMDALERSLQKTKGEKLIGSLYRGLQVYKVRCEECETISERSEDFYDIIVNVKGQSHLQGGLEELLQVEKLEGENKYDCDTCQRKTKAQRSFVLRSLPPVLLVGLNRFTYDMTTYSRMKLTSRFTYPMVLNMRKYLEEPVGPPVNYELAGVIIHQGSAYSGHYHAYLRDNLGEGHWEDPPEDVVVRGKGRGKGGEKLNGSNEEKREEEGLFTGPDKEPLKIIARILEPHTEVAIPVSSIGQKIKEIKLNPWNRLYKNKHGTINEFLSRHPDVFMYDEKAQVVKLMDDILIAMNGVGPSGRKEGLDGTNSLSLPPVGDEGAIPPANGTEPDTDGDIFSAAGLPREGGGGAPTSSSNAPTFPPSATTSKTSKTNSGGRRRWFDFDDSVIRSLHEQTIVSKPAEGRDSAYLLVYRSSELSTSTSTATNSMRNLQPPRYWRDKVEDENLTLKALREAYESSFHVMTLRVLCPSDVFYLSPHLMTKTKGGLAQALAVQVDLRAGFEKIKEDVFNALGGLEEAFNRGVPTIDLLHLHIIRERGMIDGEDALERELLYLEPQQGDLHAGSDCLQPDKAPSELLVLAWDGQVLGPEATIDTTRLPTPLTLTLHVLCPSAATPSTTSTTTASSNGPPCPQIVKTHLIHITADATVEDLLRTAGEKTGLSVEKNEIVLHGLSKAGASQKAILIYAPQVMPNKAYEDARTKHKKLMDLGDNIMYNQAEIFVERTEGRGLHAKYLAESEISRRNQSITLTISGHNHPMKDMEVDGRISLPQLYRLLAPEDGEVLEWKHDDDRFTELVADPDVPEEQSQSIIAWGLRSGTHVVVKSAEEAALLTIKFRVVTGNDQAPRLNREKLGVRGGYYTVEVSKDVTVREAKAAMCQACGLLDGANRRLRMTNFLKEEACDPPLAEEEGGEDVLVRKSPLIKGDVVLLEEGRLAWKGEICLRLCLWIPADEPMEKVQEDGRAVADPTATAAVGLSNGHASEGLDKKAADEDAAAPVVVAGGAVETNKKSGKGKNRQQKGSTSATTPASSTATAASTLPTEEEDDFIVEQEKAKRHQVLYELPPVFAMSEWSLPQLKARLAEILREEYAKQPALRERLDAIAINGLIGFGGVELDIENMMEVRELKEGDMCLPGLLLREVAIQWGVKPSSSFSSSSASSTAVAAAADEAKKKKNNSKEGGGNGATIEAEKGGKEPEAGAAKATSHQEDLDKLLLDIEGSDAVAAASNNSGKKKASNKAKGVGAATGGGENTGAASTSASASVRTLKKMGMTGGKVYVAQIKKFNDEDEVLSSNTTTTAAAGEESRTMHLWLQKVIRRGRSPPPSAASSKAAGGSPNKAILKPSWPPLEMVVGGGPYPLMRHLREAAARVLKMNEEGGGSRLALAKYNPSNYTWTVLTGPEKKQQQPRPSSPLSSPSKKEEEKEEKEEKKEEAVEAVDSWIDSLEGGQQQPSKAAAGGKAKKKKGGKGGSKGRRGSSAGAAAANSGNSITPMEASIYNSLQIREGDLIAALEVDMEEEEEEEGEEGEKEAAVIDATAFETAFDVAARRRVKRREGRSSTSGSSAAKGGGGGEGAKSGGGGQKARAPPEIALKLGGLDFDMSEDEEEKEEGIGEGSSDDDDRLPSPIHPIEEDNDRLPTPTHPCDATVEGWKKNEEGFFFCITKADD